MAESSEESRQRHKTSEAFTVEDKISSLPESVLCHILSFLPTKLAVATCILSSRWRLLWTFVPSLDFCDEDKSLNEGQVPIKAMTFVEFVNRVLILNKVQALSRFSLTCDKSGCGQFNVSTWLSSVVERNVEQIELSFNRGVTDFILLPQKFFSGCKHLVILKLNEGVLLNFTSSVDFPSLKVLHLKHVWFSREDNLRVFLSGCPVLEDLVINYQRFHEYSDSTSKICACMPRLSKLKSLDLQLRSLIVQDKRFEIDAPLLEHLHLDDCYECEYLLGNLPRLKTATLELLHEDVLNLIKGVQHVNFLTLDILLKPVRNYSSENLHVFGNLVQLELVAASGCNFLLSLVENTPKLQFLIFEERYSKSDSSLSWKEPPNVPACLSSTLKLVVLRRFGGSEDEMKLAEYILEKASVLEGLSILTKFSRLNDNFRILRTLSRTSRASVDCELLFDEVTLGLMTQKNLERTSRNRNRDRRYDCL